MKSTFNEPCNRNERKSIREIPVGTLFRPEGQDIVNIYMKTNSGGGVSVYCGNLGRPVGFYFDAGRWSGTYIIIEPDSCVELRND